MKSAATRKNTTADSPTEPTPMTAMPVRDKRGPISASTTKPAKGSAGISHNSPSTSPSHFAGDVGVQGLELVVESQHQGKPHRDLGSRHSENENEHYLPAVSYTHLTLPTIYSV